MKDLYYDVVIAGCGVAGLYTAIHLPPDKKVLLLSKDSLETCDSMLAILILKILCGPATMRTGGRALTS